MRCVGSIGAMGAWAPINISSGVTNGCQHTVLYITETIEILNRAVHDSNKAVTVFIQRSSAVNYEVINIDFDYQQ